MFSWFAHHILFRSFLVCICFALKASLSRSEKYEQSDCDFDLGWLDAEQFPFVEISAGWRIVLTQVRNRKGFFSN